MEIELFFLKHIRMTHAHDKTQRTMAVLISQAVQRAAAA